MRVRAPAVAGSFYPADPAGLRAEVARCLEAVAKPPDAEPFAKALVAPHAGTVYSGVFAAAAHRRAARLAGQVSRVVLLGPAHRAFLRGLAAPRADAFATPLGVVRVDRAGLDGLIDLPQLAVSDGPHAGEHSLEVQLPFLQAALGEFRMLPFVVGDAADEEVEELLERVWGGRETLVVVSSDLSHYHDDATARRMDAETCRAVEALEPGGIGRESACGAVPLRGLLRAARRFGLAARTLALGNSSDTAGGPGRVVGYGAWSFHASTP